MTDFNLLANDNIVEICEKMDDVSLGKFIKTSQRHYNLCSEILNKRLQEIEKDFNDFKNLKNLEHIQYTKLYPRGYIYSSSKVEMMRYPDVDVNTIKQYDTVNLESLPKLDWLFDIPPQDMEFVMDGDPVFPEYADFYQYGFVRIPINNEDAIKRAIGKLKYLGYSRSV